MRKVEMSQHRWIKAAFCTVIMLRNLDRKKNVKSKDATPTTTPTTSMLSKNIFSFFAKSPAFFALAAFMLADNCAMVWGAESLRLGFSGATATQLAGSIAVEQKLFDIYGVNV